MTDLGTHRQKIIPSNVMKKNADARILPFYMELNGIYEMCTEPKHLVLRVVSAVSGFCLVDSASSFRNFSGVSWFGLFLV